MGFLEKLRNISPRSEKKDFRETVEKERTQKYLMPTDIDEKKKKSTHPSRSKLSSFTRTISKHIQITKDFSDREQFYLRSIGIFLILATLYIVIYSPYFLLSPSKILIESLSDGIDISLAYRSIEPMYGVNLLFLDQEKVAEMIQNDQKNISSIQVDALYPNSIKVLLSAYPIVFRVSIPPLRSKEWGMTENGVLVPGVVKANSGVTRIVYIDKDISEDAFLDYQEILGPERASIIRKTEAMFHENWPDLVIDHIRYMKRENELHIVLSNSTVIIFTLHDFTEKSGSPSSTRYLRSQLVSFKTFVEAHHADFIHQSYVYIDARIPDKIFSCRDPNVCKANMMRVYPLLDENYKD